MEHRQGIEHLVLVRVVDNAGNLVEVGDQMAMVKHDALRLALAAAGEQDERRVFFVNCRYLLKILYAGAYLVKQPHVGLEVFQIHQTQPSGQPGRQLVQPPFFNEHARGQDGFQFRRFRAVHHVFRAG